MYHYVSIWMWYGILQQARACFWISSLCWVLQIPLDCESGSGHKGQGISYLSSHSLLFLTDLKANQVKPSFTLFPGVPGDVMIHNGFRDAHRAVTSGILAKVKRLTSTKGAMSVVAVSQNLLWFAGADSDYW